MAFWIPAFVISALAVLALLAARGRNVSGNAHLAVYKQQLADITRDVERGVLADAEADAQRNEISRRMLDAAQSVSTGVSQVPKWVPLVSALAVPIMAGVMYLQIGHPRFPDFPQSLRLANAEANNDLAAMGLKLERQVAKNPDDAVAWEFIVSVQSALGQHAKSADALRNLIRLKGPDAEKFASIAEALSLANGGTMSDEAAAAAEEAFKLDPRNPKARFLQGLNLSQSGKLEEAKTAFENLLLDSPDDAPWRGLVEQQLAQLNVKTANPEAQQQMIRGMVDGLAAKLAENPDDLEGWLRLIRARTVLQEDALVELNKARTQFAGKAEALAAIDGLARELKLQ